MATSHKGGQPKFGNKPDPGETIKVPNLSGFSLKKADQAIYSAGYKRRGDMIRGRYIEYRHLDGSKIWASLQSAEKVGLQLVSQKAKFGL